MALFTAASAVCVTGLSTVDTATYWSPVGQGIILVLIQIGGFGIMTLATLLGLLVVAPARAAHPALAQAETQVAEPRRRAARCCCGSLAMMVGFEAVVAAVLTARFRIGLRRPVRHGALARRLPRVSAFNNAGFALYTDT